MTRPLPRSFHPNRRRWPFAALFLLTGCSLIGLPLVHAETTAALVDKLRSAAAAETAQSDSDSESPTKDPETARRRVLRTQLRSLAQNLGRNSGYYDAENGYNDQFESLIAQIDGCSSAEEVHKLCAAILAQIKKERDSRNSELDDLFAKIRDTLPKATAPKELDDLIQTIGAKREQLNASSGSNSRRQQDGNRLQQAANFVNRWQDLLAAQAANNAAGAITILRALSNSSDYSSSSTQYTFVPRSEILTRLQQLQQSSGIDADSDSSSSFSYNRQRGAEIGAKVREIVNGIKTLPDLSAALAEIGKLGDLNRIPPSVLGDSTNSLNNTVRQLESLDRNYRSVQAGFPTSLSLSLMVGMNNTNGSGGNNALVMSLARQLFILSLPRVVGLPEDAVKPTPDEPVDSLLRREMAEAKKRSDWPALARAAEIARGLGNFANVAVLSSIDLEAYRSFCAGLTQEQAHQWAQAVLSYQTALRGGSLELPAAFIGERLEALRRDHAKEYDDGMNQFNNPAAAVDPMMRTYPAGVNPLLRRTTMDPMSRTNGRTDDISIPVPAATPKPSPAANPNPPSTSELAPTPGPSPK